MRPRKGPWFEVVVYVDGAAEEKRPVFSTRLAACQTIAGRQRQRNVTRIEIFEGRMEEGKFVRSPGGSILDWKRKEK